MNFLNKAASSCILLIIIVHGVGAVSEEKQLKLEGHSVNGSNDVVSKLAVSGSGTRGEKRIEFCSSLTYCLSGTYCCYNGACCYDGWTCCSATHCCAGAAGLVGSSLGHTVMLLCCLAYFIPTIDKYNFMQRL